MRKRFTAVVATLTFVAGCSTPVPPERSSYVGEWRGEKMALIVEADGKVIFKHVEGADSKSLMDPLREFAGDDLIVGFWPFLTTIDVTAPPREENGKWRMTVDGVVLEKAP
jgi:hypothetical protein